MANEFWLDDDQWAAIEPLLPLGRCGVQPQRNREVISGILHVLKFGCRWRDCPEVFGPPSTIYNRFNRWSKAGIWQAMFETLRTFDAAEMQSIDSTSTKAHRCSAGRKRGADAQEIGRSRGGRTTKIHAIADRLGRLIRFELSAGQKADCRAAPSLIEALPPAEHLLADTAYDSDDLRKSLLDQGTTPVIKPNPTRKHFPPSTWNSTSAAI